MNKFLIPLSMLVTTSSCLATVTISSANLEGFRDSSGALLGGGVLGLVVVDSARDGFSNTIAAQSFAIGSSLSDDDVIVNIISSEAASAFGNAVLRGGGGPAFELANGLDAGDDFAIYWFPTLTTADSELSVGDSYGFDRSSNTNSAGDWVLPSDGNATSARLHSTIASAAFRVVAVVPEPTSTTLLGLGGLSLLMRRRRA